MSCPAGPTREQLIAQSSTLRVAIGGVRSSPTLQTSHSTQDVGLVGAPAMSTTCWPFEPIDQAAGVVVGRAIEGLQLKPLFHRNDGIGEVERGIGGDPIMVNLQGHLTARKRGGIQVVELGGRARIVGVGAHPELEDHQNGPTDTLCGR